MKALKKLETGGSVYSTYRPKGRGVILTGKDRHIKDSQYGGELGGEPRLTQQVSQCSRAQWSLNTSCL